MFNNLDDDTMDASGELERVQHRRRAADAVQVRLQLRRAQPRLPVAAVPLHSDLSQKDGAGNLLFDLTLAPEQLFTAANIGTAFRFNEETRPTDAYDGDQTTTVRLRHGRHRRSRHARA